jgi:cell fate regulator YaaT (PSP1 superfamily)
LIEVVSVRFNSKGKKYFFDPSGLDVQKGENVIVETAKGLEFGECTRSNHMVDDSAVISPLRPVIRIATEADKKNAQIGKAKEKEAFEYCQRRISDFGLDMKLVNVEYGFDGNKVLFFFTSDGRVDFRELVKDLAGTFHARIELRQIGVRDEAKILGGLGVCGKPFCCSQFLSDFHPVSIKMAKTQGLSLNPTKISGTCGRLMCCLKYEELTYEGLVKKAPKVDSFVETPSGKGTIISVNLLRGNAKVRLEDGVDTTLKTFTFDELDILGGKGRRAEYIAAKAEGKLEEAGFKVSPTPRIKSVSEPARPPIRDNAQPAAQKHGVKHDRAPGADPRKKSVPTGGDIPAKDKDAEKLAKAPRQQAPDGGFSKKQHVKRYKGNRGRNR